MSGFEYKVVAAPVRGMKAKGVKTPEARFAYMLETVMNDYAAEGWEYVRADTLPATERAGLTSTQTVWRHVLVFRRDVSEQDVATEEIIVKDQASDGTTSSDTSTEGETGSASRNGAEAARSEPEDKPAPSNV